MNLLMVIIYKFCKIEFFYTSTIRTSRFLKDKITGRVDILWRIFEKITKKVKNEQERKNVILANYSKNVKKIVLFWVLWLQFNFFLQKCTRKYRPFLLFYVFYEFFCSSNFYKPFFRKVGKLNISVIYKSIIIFFLVNLPLVFIYKFCKKEIQLQPPEEPQEPQEHRLGEGL